jgi:hypothetical protein
MSQSVIAYSVVLWHLDFAFVSACTESDALQQAYEFCGDSDIKVSEEK